MQAVILCAGKSTRTHPLTVAKPKPLLRVGNRTLLEHNLDALAGSVSEVILVVGDDPLAILCPACQSEGRFFIRVVVFLIYKNNGCMGRNISALFTYEIVSPELFILYIKKMPVVGRYPQ